MSHRWGRNTWRASQRSGTSQRSGHEKDALPQIEETSTTEDDPGPSASVVFNRTRLKHLSASQLERARDIAEDVKSGAGSLHDSRPWTPRNQDESQRIIKMQSGKQRRDDKKAGRRIIRNLERQTMKTMGTMLDVEEHWIDTSEATVFFTCALLLNFVLMGLEADYAPEEHSLQNESYIVWYAVECIFTLVFLVELTLRFHAQDFELRFFQNFFNVFDLIAVGVALMELTIAFAVEALPVDVGWLGVLRVFRLMRLLRMVRIFRFVQSVRRQIWHALMDCRKALLFVGSTMVMLIYVGAIFMSVTLGSDIKVDVCAAEAAGIEWKEGNLFNLKRMWGSIPRSMFSLFAMVTGEGWYEIATVSLEYRWWSCIFFVPFMVTAHFMVLNLIVGIMVESVNNAKRTETLRREREADKTMIEKLSEIFVMIDIDSDNHIKLGELQNALNHEHTRELFDRAGVFITEREVDTAMQYWCEYVDEDGDADDLCDMEISVYQFIRGANDIKRRDVNKSIEMIRRDLRDLFAVADFSGKRLRSSQSTGNGRFSDPGCRLGMGNLPVYLRRGASLEPWEARRRSTQRLSAVSEGEGRAYEEADASITSKAAGGSSAPMGLELLLEQQSLLVKSMNSTATRLERTACQQQAALQTAFPHLQAVVTGSLQIEDVEYSALEGARVLKTEFERACETSIATAAGTSLANTAVTLSAILRSARGRSTAFVRSGTVQVDYKIVASHGEGASIESSLTTAIASHTLATDLGSSLAEISGISAATSGRMAAVAFTTPSVTTANSKEDQDTLAEPKAMETKGWRSAYSPRAESGGRPRGLATEGEHKIYMRSSVTPQQELLEETVAAAIHKVFRAMPLRPDDARLPVEREPLSAEDLSREVAEQKALLAEALSSCVVSSMKQDLVPLSFSEDRENVPHIETPSMRSFLSIVDRIARIQSLLPGAAEQGVVSEAKRIGRNRDLGDDPPRLTEGQEIEADLSDGSCLSGFNPVSQAMADSGGFRKAANPTGDRIHRKPVTTNAEPLEPIQKDEHPGGESRRPFRSDTGDGDPNGNADMNTALVPARGRPRKKKTSSMGAHGARTSAALDHHKDVSTRARE